MSSKVCFLLCWVKRVAQDIWQFGSIIHFWRVFYNHLKLGEKKWWKLMIVEIYNPMAEIKSNEWEDWTAEITDSLVLSQCHTMWQKLSGAFTNQTFPPPHSISASPSLTQCRHCLIAAACSPSHLVSFPFWFLLSLANLQYFFLSLIFIVLSRWMLWMETPSNENSEHSTTPSNDAAPSEDNIVPEATNHGYIPLPLHVWFIFTLPLV